MALIRKWIEQLKKWLLRVKDFFYDSYSGWKKKRLAVAGGSAVAALGLVIAVIITLPSVIEIIGSGDAEDPHIPSIQDVLPGAFQGSGQMAPAPNPRDVSTPTPGQEWSYDDRRWSGPVLGDIDSHGGSTSEEDSRGEPLKEGDEGVYTVPNPYEFWELPIEVRSTVKRTVERLQNNLLMRMHVGATESDWAKFAADMSTMLMDAPFIGEQVQRVMSEETVSIWTELEAVYGRLYVEVYSCESVTDFLAVADGATRLEAMELTAQFIEALDREAVN